MSDQKRQMETTMIHGEGSSANPYGSLTTPLYQTSTFSFQAAHEGEERFAGKEEGYIYTRLGNPTVKELEDRIAALEGGEKGLAFSSGMAAVSAVLTSLTKTGDHILCSKGLYGCTFGLLTMLTQKYGISHSFSLMEDEQSLRSQITKDTSCIFIETPINPTMKVIDLHLVARVAKEYKIPVVVDNTFSTPYLQRPLEAGCDIVLHSATKYIGGHGDVVAGLVVGKQTFIEKLSLSEQKDMGGVLSPFDAWLLIRGLKTLHLRVDRHSSNAEIIEKKLRHHPFIKKVYYPGSEEHPSHSVISRQMRKGGGVIAFDIKGNKADAQQFMDHLQLIKIAVSLGDAETLIQHPASMTHSVVPREERREMGIDDTLVRLSVGLEAWQDIWADMEQSFNKCMEKES